MYVIMSTLNIKYVCPIMAHQIYSVVSNSRCQVMTVPAYISDLESLKTYLRRRTIESNTKQKGDLFAELIENVFPLCGDFREYSQPTRNPKAGSHDEGVDLIAKHASDPAIEMFIQAKWALDRVDEIDSILSKFMTFSMRQQNKEDSGQLALDLKLEDRKTHFMIASLDKLEGLIKKYEAQTGRPTYNFYQKLRNENRLHFLDGSMIVDVLGSEWRKSNQSKLSKTLRSSANGWLNLDEVYVGIVSGKVLRDLYFEFGRSIFFDNIRDYLGNTYKGGDDADSVNDSIMETIRNSAGKMLARNNGIVIRATNVRKVNSHSLHLDNMSIVNGCQTTMSIINSGEAGDDCHVLVKIVKVEDEEHWEITRTANMQNEVSRIELDLAQWLRPQIVRLAAYNQEQAFDSDDVFAFLSTINSKKVQYENIRAMFIGLFSSKPYNILRSDRRLIQLDLVKRMYEEDPRGEYLFSVLFKLHASAQESIPEIQEVFGEDHIETFSRLLDENKGFISYIAILAACAAVNMDVSNFNPGRIEESFRQLKDFITQLSGYLESHQSEMAEYFVAAYHAVTTTLKSKHSDSDKSTFRRYMSSTLRDVNFSTLISQTHDMYNFRKR